MYTIQQAQEKDVPECYDIICQGREFQKQQGFVQWTDDYPNMFTISDDISAGCGYVLSAGGEIAG